MSLTGRSTCVSASALSLDAQPAQVDRVVRRISRPVWGMGIGKLIGDSQGLGGLPPIFLLLVYGVLVSGGCTSDVVSGSGKMNWLPDGTKIVCTPGDNFNMY